MEKKKHTSLSCLAVSWGYSHATCGGGWLISHRREGDRREGAGAGHHFRASIHLFSALLLWVILKDDRSSLLTQTSQNTFLLLARTHAQNKSQFHVLKKYSIVKTLACVAVSAHFELVPIALKIRYAFYIG